MHPVLWQFGSIRIYSYGFFTALAMLVTFFIAQKKAEPSGLSRQVVADLFFLLFISGVVGARLFYVLQHFSDYSGDLPRVFFIQEGGLVWYGGFFGAAIAGIFYARAHRWPLLKLSDFFAPILALGHAIGRIGCFFNGCCFGQRCSLPWAVTFPGDPYARHPVQLYEAALLFILSFFLFRFAKKKRFDGQVLSLYALGYGTLRLLVEFLRGDQTRFGLLTLPQWTSALLIAGAAIFYSALQKRSR